MFPEKEYRKWGGSEGQSSISEYSKPYPKKEIEEWVENICSLL